ncbi:DUF4279 domain-containing protein [Ottowia thiooxydans]|uniref:DUF4279 domain-containing protein n=1 Tax=Ottowia thiooxydans TaxID=219182 RepID=UPI0012EBC400|nr:DUF4279 domain-containing protein [Ottowia thiooxydans]
MKNDFFLSLRLRKKEGDLSCLANTLGLNIKRIWSNGDSLPKNRTADYSYCVCEIEENDNFDLGQTIENIAATLAKKRDDIEDFSNSGGHLSLFISLDSNGFSGTTLDSSQLKLLGDLRVSLEINRLN